MVKKLMYLHRIGNVLNTLQTKWNAAPDTNLIQACATDLSGQMLKII